MAIRTLKLDEEWEFESKYDSDKGKEGATKFVLGTLSSRVVSSLQDGATKFRPTAGKDGEEAGMEADFLPNQMAYEVVRFGLKGVKGLLDADGKPVKFKTATRHIGGADVKCAAETILKALPLDLLRELSEEIQTKNVLTEGETKN